MKKLIITMCVLLTCIAGYSQEKKADRQYADWNDARAAELYEKAIAKAPTQELYYKLGKCYEGMKLFDKAQQNYDKVKELGAFNDPEYYLHYGLVLKTNEKYVEAREAFRIYDKMVPSDKRGKFYMQSCDVAIEDRKWDEPIPITNIDALNTPQADFSPVTYKDGMVFTSDRHAEDHEKIYGKTGGYYLNIFYVKNGGTCTDFSKAILLKNCTGFNEPAPLQGKDINLAYHNGPVSFSRNYDTVFISRVKKDLTGEAKTTLGIERNKIWYTHMKDGQWTDIEQFPYNSDSFSVALPYLTQDGKRLYFASDMPGGYGETDIYYCDRQGSGWNKPVNMGPNINTFGREKFPYIDQEGNFYFSSDGYLGFGGLDICVAQNVNGQLVKAIPLKCPINSSRDDFGMLSLQNGKTGYFSSNRAGGMGQDDIYYFDLGASSDLLAKYYTIGYRPNLANIHVTFVDSKTDDALDKGHFWAYTKQTKKTYDVEFKGGALDFTAKERSRLFMRAYVEGYNMYYDTLVLPNMNADTNISLVFKMKKPKNLITMGSKYGHNAYFDFDKSTLRPDAKVILDSVVGYMKANPDVRVLVEGHTDTRGSDKYNMVLSKSRAVSALRYIKSKGISMSRLKSQGFSYHQVVNRCTKDVECSEEEHQQNRRVEFRFEESGMKTTANIP